MRMNQRTLRQSNRMDLDDVAGGREGKGVIFATILLAWSGWNRTLVTLLRPWIRRFTMIICAWWLQTKNYFSGQEFEEIHRNIK